MKKIEKRGDNLMYLKFRKAIIKISDIINKPVIRGISKFSSNLLQTMSLVKERSPLSIATAGFSILNSLSESFDLPLLSPLDSYIKSNNLVIATGSLPKIIYRSNILNEKNSSRIFSTEEESLIELEINENSKLYILKLNDVPVNTTSSDHMGNISEEYYFTQGFEFDKLFEKIWEKYPHGIFLTRHRHSCELELVGCPDDTPIYIGEHDVDELYKRLRKALDAGISRSFLLVGAPGVGKTSLALKIAHKYFRRTIKIDPHVTRSLESGELEFFVEQMNPEVIIFEDFDRAFEFADVALSMLENLKKYFPQLVIFGTVNDISMLDRALLRPGRFDKILHFNSPEESYRLQILELYFSMYGPDIPATVLNAINKQTDKFTPIYLRELAIESNNLSNENFINEISELINEYHLRMQSESYSPKEETEEEYTTISKVFAKEIKEGLSAEDWLSVKENL